MTGTDQAATAPTDTDLTEADLTWAYAVTADDLPMCGCGIPDAAAASLIDLLQRLQAEDWDEPRDRDPVDHYLQLCILDRAGLTDHGTSIHCSWLTAKGARFLGIVERAGWEVVSEHGYSEDALTGDGLTAHLADIIAVAADQNGTHDHHGQAADVLDWLDRRSLLATPATAVPTEHADVPMVAMPETEYEALRRAAAAALAVVFADDPPDGGGSDERDTARRELEDARELYALAGDDRTAQAIALEDANAEVERLRALLGLQPGEDVCGASDRTGTQACLLPARHIGEGRWHRCFDGAWTL